MVHSVQARPAYGMLLMALAAAAGTALAIYAWFFNEGINHTDGVLVVMGSSALMVVGAVLVATLRAASLRGVLLVLLLLDVFGTGVAAWFLEAPVLMAFMGVALLGWLLHLAAGARRVPPRAVPISAEPAA